ncbi:MAG: hypothetical protein RIS56_507 [Verrucomicrobiota bacterium]|jgi:hypothetical protein
MKPPFIIIHRHPYEEPYHLNLVISASNGVMSGTLEYYCNAEDLGEVGGKLAVFPERKGDTYVYELGSPRPEDRFAFHFALRTSTLDSAGHCALQLTMNNNRPSPDDVSCSFSIRAEPAAINRLGRLLTAFGELMHSELRWSDTDGELIEGQTTIAEPDGPANGSHPIRLETNSTSSADGSRR